jgi:hypothetical protein
MQLGGGKFQEKFIIAEILFSMACSTAELTSQSLCSL